MAPGLNHFLSNRTTLISQYEVGGQPYSLLFRCADLIAGLLVIGVALRYYQRVRNKLPLLLLILIGVGMAIDPIATTNCLVNNLVCTETHSFTFFIHAIETVLTASAILALSAYDARTRHKLVSIGYVLFQAAYGVLFLTQYADQQHFTTASQYAYQYITVIWLAWFVRDYLLSNYHRTLTNKWRVSVRYIVAIWVLLNGLLAIMLSLTNISLWGRAQALYFSRDTAWLAQHGVIVGVIMLYLFRHLLRGERRARQIVLAIIGLEALKYAVLSPNWGLALLYSFSFCLVFVTVDEFARGSVALTWQLRLKDLAYLGIGLLTACLLVAIVLDRDSHVSHIAQQSYSHFTEYALHSDAARLTHKESALLANTTTAFMLASIGAVLWILFKPYRFTGETIENYTPVKQLLERHATTPDDFFKLWPEDKQYYYNHDRTGFIAYKLVGSVAFALADPICTPAQRGTLVQEFIAWARARRLTACFVAVPATSLTLYRSLKTLQIGAAAIINIQDFIATTYEEKWWRWKKNRAVKQGYSYAVNHPPHTAAFMNQLQQLSDSWLATAHHQERGFALGYFDHAYLQQCSVHYLKNQHGQVVAFANQLPTFNSLGIQSVDLMRYRADATDTMPFLLANIIQQCSQDGATLFDLGFVPFAETTGPLLNIAQTLSSNRFSSKGLRQFKNKFKPDWQKVYLAYDGDLVDLGVIALQIESAMKKR